MIVGGEAAVISSQTFREQTSGARGRAGSDAELFISRTYSNSSQLKLFRPAELIQTPIFIAAQHDHLGQTAYNQSRSKVDPKSNSPPELGGKDG